jgi:hypothetical protein
VANICKNTIAAVGLRVAPDIFVRELSKVLFGLDLDNLDPTQWGEDGSVNGKAWYSTLTAEYRKEGSYAARCCILYLTEPYVKFGITIPRLYVETKWETPLDKLCQVSKLFPDLKFHVDWWISQDGPAGEYVSCNGEVVESIKRLGSQYLFDSILYPSIGLLSAHLPLTLTQHATARLHDAIALVRGLKEVLEDDRFKYSSHTPFSACRDDQQTAKVYGALSALLLSMTKQVEQIDFHNVLLEREDLPAAYARSLESTRQLMTALGLAPLIPDQGKALRFAIVPATVAIVSDPYRVILPVVNYTNADPVSGKYEMSATGLQCPLEWNLRHVCLTQFEVNQLNKLLEDSETVYDIDVAMAPSADGIMSHALHCVARRARWARDPEIAKEVLKVVREASTVFAAGLAHRPGVTIFTDYRALESAIHPTSAMPGIQKDRSV